MRKLLVHATGAALLLMALGSAGSAQEQTTGPAAQEVTVSKPKSQADETAVKDFEKRVSDFETLREQAGGGDHRPSASAEKVNQQQKDLAAKIQEARRNAKVGDIFTPEIGAYLRRQIGRSIAAPKGHRIKKSLAHAEPVKNIEVHVNEPYPAGVPLQSMPPSLLKALPKLPNGLEYRIVDHSLVLLDTPSNLVIDALPHAIPAP